MQRRARPETMRALVMQGTPCTRAACDSRPPCQQRCGRGHVPLLDTSPVNSLGAAALGLLADPVNDSQ